MNFVTEMIHDNTYFSEFNNFLDGYQIVEKHWEFLQISNGIKILSFDNQVNDQTRKVYYIDIFLQLIFFRI